MEYDHRSANSPLHHRATAPLLDADDVPVNMQQTQSAEAIPIYDTHPQAYAVAIPVNSQQRTLASSSFETTSLISPIRSGSGEANSVVQVWTKQIFVCLFIIIAIVGVVLLATYIGRKSDDDDDDDD
jgi:hypothetical protein